jgi:hypothetical protein
MKLLWNQPVVTLQLDFYNEDSILVRYIMNFYRLTDVSEKRYAFQFRTRTEKTVFSAVLILGTEDEALPFLRNGGSNL